MTSDDNFDVIIAGGGLAGLTCAVALSRAGLRIVLLERDRILGGRAQSWIDPVTGDPVSIGPHILVSEYPNMLKLLDLLETREKIVWDKNTFVTMVEGQHRIPMKMSMLPAPFHFVPSLLADRTLANADWLSNVPVTLLSLSLRESDILSLDRFAAVDILRQLRVSANYIDRFWRFLSLSIMNVPLELCSAGAILRLYRRLIGQGGYRMGFPDGGLGDLFAEQSRQFIHAKAGTILLNTEIRRLLLPEEGGLGVELTDGRKLHARFCVAALPPQALFAVLPSTWQSRPPFHLLPSFQPVPYISVFLWFDRKLTELKFWARVYRKEDLNLDFYDLSNIIRSWRGKPSVIASNIIFSSRIGDLTDSEIIQRTTIELSEFAPEARTAQLRDAVVNRIPMAIPAPFVGSEQLRPDTSTPIPGLFLAGDWIQTGLPASMESACLSGWRAAERVLEQAGKPAKLTVPHSELDWSARTLGRFVRRARHLTA